MMRLARIAIGLVVVAGLSGDAAAQAPQAPAHVLVIPKRHFTDLDAAGEEDESLLGALLLGAKRAAALAGLSGGYRVVVNRGRDGG